MSGLYLFSAISLSVVGLAQHSRIISGDSFFTLNSIVSILKRIQQLQSFFVGKVNTVSQSDALANVIEDKSLLTFDWTNFQEEFELWDSQQLSFLTIDPVLRGKEKSKLCEFAIEFVFAESTNGETEFNELLTSTFSPAQTRLMNNMYTNLLILNERKEQQWPGLANSLSNLAASKVTTTRSLALGLPAELAIGGILPLISDFLEKPTDQNVNRCAESILRLN
jgi:hypothetical protein